MFRTQSTPESSVAEHYGLRNTTCLYSKDVASGPWFMPWCMGQSYVYTPYAVAELSAKQIFTHIRDYLREFETKFEYI
jgi:hypothetical protein